MELIRDGTNTEPEAAAFVCRLQLLIIDALVVDFARNLRQILKIGCHAMQAVRLRC